MPNQLKHDIENNSQSSTDNTSKLSEKDSEFNQLIAGLHVGVIKQGPDASILLSNEMALELLGITEDQLLGKTSFDADWNVIDESGSFLIGEKHPVPVAIATRKAVKNVVMGVYRPVKKDRVWLLVNAIPELDEQNNVKYVICTFSDITSNKLAEEEIIRSKRLFEFTSKVNDLVLHANDANEIYQSICDIAINNGGFRFAFLGFKNESKETVDIYKWAGYEDGYINILKNTLSTNKVPGGSGPTGKAIREGKYFYCNDISINPEMALWRDHALKRGYLSSITLPIRLEGKTIAVLAMYAGKANFFNEVEIQLLLRAIENINFALKNFSLSLKHDALLNQMKKVTQAIEQTSASILITDTQGRIEYMNSAFAKASGFCQEEVLGNTFKNIESEYFTELEYKRIWRTINNQKEWRGEFCKKKKNGELYWVFAIISPVLDHSGKTSNFIIVEENISKQKEILLSLEKKNQKLKDIAWSQSHLVRAPLARILGLVRALNRGIVENEQVKTFYEYLDSSASELDSVIKNITLQTME